MCVCATHHDRQCSRAGGKRQTKDKRTAAAVAVARQQQVAPAPASPPAPAATLQRNIAGISMHDEMQRYVEWQGCAMNMSHQ